ncbi:MAG: DUF2911 domain-containing protein, partial [Gemmatimonadetes bacterium]|nr:DUF2911 domain-containing protein [Gemmatimonadota bacterium]
TTFALPNQFGVPLQVTTDRAGRIVSVEAGGGTTVQRLAWVDIDALEREFRRRDDAGTGLGPLSPLDTVTASVKGAAIEVEYSRPSLRGRPLALLVPDGQVWRTGANDATHLRTDRALRFGSVSVPAGTYTIFTLPSAAGWKLIINRQTGQAGTDYDQGQDLARIDMTVRNDAPATERFTIDVAETNEGGVLRLRWGTTEASLPFRIES